MEVNLHALLVLEDSQLQQVDSVAAYVEELEYFKALVDHHIQRCRTWNRASPRDKAAFGKLHKFLTEMEA